MLHSALDHPVRLRFGTTDSLVFEDVIVKQHYNFGLPSRADVIVDAGANIGLTSLFYANRFPRAKIFAIEAENSNFQLLQKNVLAYPNITPIHAALLHKDGNTTVAHPPYDPSGHWGFVVEGDQGNVLSLTFPALMHAFDIDYVDLLKVNIEGSEKEVFEACDWQDRLGSVVIELHDQFKPGCTEAVDCALRGFSRSASGYLTCYQNRHDTDNPQAVR